MTPVHHDLLKEFRALAASAASAKPLMERIAQRLHEKMTKFNWVGFYLADPTDPGVLLVGPFVGSFTPHSRIPLNTGLCGAAASSGQVVVVQDVTKDPRYLAGSPMVKSEIVVPIFVHKKLAGQLDIESYFLETFNKTEQEFVEACAQIVGEYLGKS
jgi:L-methionine (R)-S-oxide reductase